MWHFMDILQFCPFMVEDKAERPTGEIRLTLCRAVNCIWLFPLCSCMMLRMDSDFTEEMKRIQNKVAASFSLFMFNPYCCLEIMRRGIVVKKKRGKELVFLPVILPNVLKISYCWHFTLKQGVWTEEQMQLWWAAAQLKTCTGNPSWEILKKPSKHLCPEYISLKKNCSVVLRNVCRQLGALKMCHTLHNAISTVRRATVH